MTETILIVILFVVSCAVLLLAVQIRRLQEDIRDTLEENEHTRKMYEERREHENAQMENERVDAQELIAELHKELSDSYSSLELVLQDNMSKKKVGK